MKLSRIPIIILQAPIHLYRWTLRPYVGWQCRHLPTCSDYALEAIEKNGAWRGFWLTVSRLARCWPWGTAGYDPVPDLDNENHVWMPWRYGRWSGSHMEGQWRAQQPNKNRRAQQPNKNRLDKQPNESRPGKPPDQNRLVD
ncbi:MAG: membrane protein insertion efficiency factor YidD [Hyphomicrobiaceae bacterium]